MINISNKKNLEKKFFKQEQFESCCIKIFYRFVDRHIFKYYHYASLCSVSFFSNCLFFLIIRKINQTENERFLLEDMNIMNTHMCVEVYHEKRTVTMYVIYIIMTLHIHYTYVILYYIIL